MTLVKRCFGLQMECFNTAKVSFSNKQNLYEKYYILHFDVMCVGDDGL